MREQQQPIRRFFAALRTTARTDNGNSKDKRKSNGKDDAPVWFAG
jgi:hypothetical protein